MDKKIYSSRPSPHPFVYMKAIYLSEVQTLYMKVKRWATTLLFLFINYFNFNLKSFKFCGWLLD